ncbi:hypothetical protein SUGI_0423660 [Cryptomeria japonica]|nr:hypothetical protein SUGI_0423660 [Cryptomeria japonica]
MQEIQLQILQTLCKPSSSPKAKLTKNIHPRETHQNNGGVYCPHNHQSPAVEAFKYTLLEQFPRAVTLASKLSCKMVDLSESSNGHGF